MEAIKCPNCGSEKVKEITEEKYVCLACDNVFLVHNLSKEFRATDSHISEVHQDIREKLDSIKEIASSSNSDENEMKEMLYDAEKALKDQEYLYAYEIFEKYAAMKPESAIGYEGMFRSLTANYTISRLIPLEENQDSVSDRIKAEMTMGFDLLRKAFACEDCNKEELVSKVLNYYKQGTGSAYVEMYADIEDAATDTYHEYVKNKLKHYSDEELQEKQQKFIEQMTKSPNLFRKKLVRVIENLKEDNKRSDDRIQENQKEINEYESLTDQEKRSRRLKSPSFIITIIFTILAIGMFGTQHYFWMVIFIIIDVIALMALFGNDAPENLSSRLENEEFIQKIETVIDELHTIDSLTNSEMEQIIQNDNKNTLSGEEVYREIKARMEEERLKKEQEEQERAREAEEEAAGYFEVTLQSWGKNASAVRDVLISCCEPSYVKNCYKQRCICKITGFKRSEAYDLQKKLMNMGAIVYVNQM
mgnify:CR=1 FL=1